MYQPPAASASLISRPSSHPLHQPPTASAAIIGHRISHRISRISHISHIIRSPPHLPHQPPISAACISRLHRPLASAAILVAALTVCRISRPHDPSHQPPPQSPASDNRIHRPPQPPVSAARISRHLSRRIRRPLHWPPAASAALISRPIAAASAGATIDRISCLHLPPASAAVSPAALAVIPAAYAGRHRPPQ